MIRKIVFIAFLALLNSSWAFSASITKMFLYSEGVYNVLDIPGNTEIITTDLPGNFNNSGEFVGQFRDAFGVIHGFWYTGGFFQEIPLIPLAINNLGQIAGSQAGTGRIAIYANGVLTTIPNNLPDSLTDSASVFAINDFGQIVGLYGTNAGIRGFLYDGGAFTRIHVPGSPHTVAWGINNSGDIVGPPEFLYSGGVFTDLNSGAAPIAINDAGQITGGGQVCTNGFLYQNGNLIFLNAPGSFGTGARDINAAGQVVGSFCTDAALSMEHGYIYSDGTYTAIDVPGSAIFGKDVTVLGTHPIAINDLGQVYGTVTYTTPEPSICLLLISSCISMVPVLARHNRPH